MRKSDEEKALETLNRIETLTSGEKYINETCLPEISSDTLSLMIKVARRKQGLELLIDRYGSSHSANIVGALGFVLKKKAETTNLKNAYLLFKAIEKLKRKDNPGILGIFLTAIKFQIGIAKVWQHISMPKILYTFLRHCLDFSDNNSAKTKNTLSEDVQLDVISVLQTMCEIGIYESNFEESQREWFENKLAEAANSNFNNNLFQASISYFFDCITKLAVKQVSDKTK